MLFQSAQLDSSVIGGFALRRRIEARRFSDERCRPTRAIFLFLLFVMSATASLLSAQQARAHADPAPLIQTVGQLPSALRDVVTQRSQQATLFSADQDRHSGFCADDGGDGVCCSMTVCHLVNEPSQDCASGRLPRTGRLVPPPSPRLGWHLLHEVLRPPQG